MLFILLFILLLPVQFQPFPLLYSFIYRSSTWSCRDLVMLTLLSFKKLLFLFFKIPFTLYLLLEVFSISRIAHVFLVSSFSFTWYSFYFPLYNMIFSLGCSFCSPFTLFPYFKFLPTVIFSFLIYISFSLLLLFHQSLPIVLKSEQTNQFL